MNTQRQIQQFAHNVNQQAASYYNPYVNVNYGPADYQPVNGMVLLLVAIWAIWWVNKEGLM